MKDIEIQKPNSSKALVDSRVEPVTMKMTKVKNEYNRRSTMIHREDNLLNI
jgi:hypothetical protein